eukprot:gene10089-18741_t
MLAEALNQVEKRLPKPTAVFKGLSSLSPGTILSLTSRVAFNDLPMPHLRAVNQDDIEQQFRKILHVAWVEESVFDGRIPTDTVKFWSGVLQYKTSSGCVPFRELAIYALSCFSTPGHVSNAVVERVFSTVERVFSTVTNVKTKVLNRLGSKMLDTIIQICTHLQFQGKCCKDFTVTKDMFERFTSQNMYSNADDEQDQDLMREDDELTLLKYV